MDKSKPMIDKYKLQFIIPIIHLNPGDVASFHKYPIECVKSGELVTKSGGVFTNLNASLHYIHPRNRHVIYYNHNAQVDAIRQQFSDGAPYKFLSDRFNLTIDQIDGVVNDDKYYHRAAVIRRNPNA